MPASFHIVAVAPTPQHHTRLRELLAATTTMGSPQVVESIQAAADVLAAQPNPLVVLVWEPEDLDGTPWEGVDLLAHQAPLIAAAPRLSPEQAQAALEVGIHAFALWDAPPPVQFDLAATAATESHRTGRARQLLQLEVQEIQDRTARMVQALDRANAELDAQYQKAHLLTRTIEQSDITILITDKDGTILYVNPAFEKSTGYSREEALGQTPRILKSGLHDAAFYKNLWTTILAGKEWHARIKNRRKDGTIFEEDARISAVRDEDGTISRFIATKRDVTHETALEMQLLQARKLEAVGQLAAGIAHEINTPSQFVGDNLRFLDDAFGALSRVFAALKDIADSPEVRAAVPDKTAAYERCAEEEDIEFLLEDVPQAIAQAVEGIERISRIVLAMKTFSHPGGDHMSPADLNKALESTVTVCTNEWKYVAQVNLDLDPHLPAVPCLLGEMNQVFLNVIVNAAHAIGAANRPDKGTITVRTFADDPFAVVAISDDGCGMPPEVKARIFDPFFTTKEVGKGTGQGLAIAHATVVDKHKGRIDVESEPGKGTTFFIRIPLQQAGGTDG